MNNDRTIISFTIDTKYFSLDFGIMKFPCYIFRKILEFGVLVWSMATAFVPLVVGYMSGLLLSRILVSNFLYFFLYFVLINTYFMIYYPCSCFYLVG
ncbi:hypothetical protein HN873_014458 [Arachis hypogaea]